ncbi:MAG: hypothetical protein WBF17_18775, partial [Phycisphaerae bacterium]
MFADEDMVVWFRRVADPKTIVYRRDAGRGAIHVFSPSESLGVIPVGAEAGIYTPSVIEVPGGILILSYDFGRPAQSVEQTEYVAQVHLVASARCELVLNETLKPARYDHMNRFVSGCFALTEDTFGRALLMKVEYTNPRHDEDPKVTRVEGR